MRIETGQGQAWAGDAIVALERVMGEAGDMADAVFIDQRDGPLQRLMDGHQHDAQSAAGQHHGRPSGAVLRHMGRQPCEEFGMPGEGETGLIHD